MSDSSSWSFSLSREEILRRRLAREKIAARIAELQQELEAEDRWFDAISLILPPALKASLPGAAILNDAVESRSVWRRAIEQVVSVATKGLLPKEIAQGIRDDGEEDAKERLQRNPNGIYSAIERMIDDGQIVRHNERLYSSALYAALDASGELDSEVDSTALKGVNLFIVNTIKEHGAVPSKTIIEMMRGSAEFGDKQLNNPQYGYSAIQRCVRQGYIERTSANRYQLVSNENEPSDGDTSDGSDAGSGKGVFA